MECEEEVLEEVFELSVLEEITVEQLGDSDKPVNGQKKVNVKEDSPENCPEIYTF